MARAVGEQARSTFRVGSSANTQNGPRRANLGPVSDDWQPRGGDAGAPGSRATRSLDRGTWLQTDGSRDRFAATYRTLRVGRPLGIVATAPSDRSGAGPAISLGIHQHTFPGGAMARGHFLGLAPSS